MTVVLGCTVWIPLMLWIIALIHWIIGNEIELVSGLLGIGVGLALGYMCLQPPVPFMQPVSYLSVWITLVAFPFVRAGLNQRELRAVDLHALERAYEVLNERPREAMGRFRLAQAAWKMGMTGHAIRIGEGCLPELDPKHFREEHMIVKGWHRQMAPAEMFADYACAQCGGACPPGRTHCPKCGAPFLLDRLKGVAAFGKGTGRKIVAAWAGGAGALAGVSWATTLPPGPAIGAIVVVLGIAFLVVFLAFRPQGQAT